MATTFKVGDLVIYTGNFTERFIGHKGVVKKLQKDDSIRVEWFNPKPTNSDGEVISDYGIKKENLQLIPKDEHDLLQMLINKKITSDEYQRMSGD
jgi:hypothetical protein